MFDKSDPPRVSRKPRYRVKKLYARGVFQRCVAGNTTNVQLLLGQLDEGEAEALVQGSETGARVFIADETAARKNSEHRGMKAVGTASLLARLALEGRAPDTHSLIRRLRRDLDFRITDAVVTEAIKRAAEPIVRA